MLDFLEKIILGDGVKKAKTKKKPKPYSKLRRLQKRSRGYDL